MPKRQPIDPELRERIGDDIAMQVAGRNELARRHGVSPGTVSNIARERGLWFPQCTQTATASQARQIDCAAVRLEKEAELWDELLGLKQTTKHDGSPTRRWKRLDRQLDGIHRHAKSSQPF